MKPAESKNPPEFRITHSFPPPRPDDCTRFSALVRMLLRFADETQAKAETNAAPKEKT
jgi:hypothetical protein